MARKADSKAGGPVPLTTEPETGPKQAGVDLAVARTVTPDSPDEPNRYDVAIQGEPEAGPRAESPFAAAAPEADNDAEPAPVKAHGKLSDEDAARFVKAATDALERHAVLSETDAYGRQWTFRQETVSNQAMVVITMQGGPDVRQQSIQAGRFSEEFARNAITTLDGAFR